VLDLGTGSGILAIAAARLGARQVLALDTDAVAVEVARANIQANGLADIVAVERGSLPLPVRGPTFDVVAANIIARVILDLATPLAEALAPAGTLIASGILLQREPEVAAALRAAGLRVVGRRHDGDWLALVAQR
jgi:ribosomal protein L11 methyltransferase